ncbi:hypothetical protein GPALN_009760 [Globodera pallida]|nr:hypothetical protein GPALN_009760 [Globodera pallida]
MLNEVLDRLQLSRMKALVGAQQRLLALKAQRWQGWPAPFASSPSKSPMVLARVGERRRGGAIVRSAVGERRRGGAIVRSAVVVVVAFTVVHLRS